MRRGQIHLRGNWGEDDRRFRKELTYETGEGDESKENRRESMGFSISCPEMRETHIFKLGYKQGSEKARAEKKQQGPIHGGCKWRRGVGRMRGEN